MDFATEIDRDDFDRGRTKAVQDALEYIFSGGGLTYLPALQALMDLVEKGQALEALRKADLVLLPDETYGGVPKWSVGSWDGGQLVLLATADTLPEAINAAQAAQGES